MENAVHLLKCACANCGEMIEYRPKAAGQIVQCPKCKQRSALPIPSPAEPEDIGPKPPPTCPACGSFLDDDLSCAQCGRRRRNRTLLWGVGSAVGLLAIGAIVLALLNRPAKKAAALPQPQPKAPSMMILSQPAVRAPKSLNDLRVGKFYLQQQRGSPLILAVGEIQNVSQNAHLHVTVSMDLLDAKGAKLGTITDVNNLIRPGDRWQPLAKITDPRVANVRFAGLKEGQ